MILSFFRKNNLFIEKQKNELTRPHIQSRQTDSVYSYLKQINFFSDLNRLYLSGQGQNLSLKKIRKERQKRVSERNVWVPASA